MSGGVIPGAAAYEASVAHVVTGATAEDVLTCTHCGGRYALVPNVDSVQFVMALAAFGRRHATCEPREPWQMVPSAGPVSGFLGELLERQAGDVVVCVYDHTTREARIGVTFECRACGKERYVCEEHEAKLTGGQRVLCVTRGCRQVGKAMRLTSGPPEVRQALGEMAKGERSPRRRTSRAPDRGRP